MAKKSPEKQDQELPVQRAKATLVVKGNKLINARYNLSLGELRLFLLMITQIRREDRDFATYRIQMTDFIEALDTSAKNVYERAKSTSRQLMEKVIEIEEEDGPLQVALLSSAKYYDGKGYIDLRFDPALKPYLLQLKEKFTTYDLNYVFRLQSVHAVRIYELLKQYEPIGSRIISVFDLKDILGVADQYTRYNDFKRFVILQAQRDIKKNTDIAFDFEEYKEGRRITQIKFIIHSKRKQQGLPQRELSEEQEEQLQALQKMGLSLSQSQQLLESKPVELIRRAIAYTQKRYRQTKGSQQEIKNPSAYLLKMLESDGSELSPFEQEEKRQSEVAARRAEAQKQVQKEAEKRRVREQEMIEEFKKAYAAERESQAARRVDLANEADWQAFEAYVQEHFFLKDRLLDPAGHLDREDPNVRLYAGHYLFEEENPRTPEAFIAWVRKVHNLQLAQVQRGDPNEFRIVGEQTHLF